MTGKIGLLIFKDRSGLDISELVQQIRWGGRTGSCARNLEATLVDDDGYGHARSGIDVEEGYQCIFTYEGMELFRGIIMKTVQDAGKNMSFTAYDNGIYLANNKDTFIYERKTATDVLRDVCGRFGLPTGEVAECGYKIPDLTKGNTTAFDAVADALSLDYKNTGVRHFVLSRKGEISLLTRRENIIPWVIGAGENLTSYSFSRSIEHVKTRIKMRSNEETVMAEAANAQQEEKIGVFQDIENTDETLSLPQLNELCSSLLKEKSAVPKTLHVEAIGRADVISGMGVFVCIPHIGISGTFYVDEDSHTFAAGKHLMSLSLSVVNDLDAGVSGESGGDGFSVGDLVWFSGGSHYVSSNALTPTGSPCKPGPARITLQAKGARHPWHLVHTDSQSRVYGWVDDGSFDRENNAT